MDRALKPSNGAERRGEKRKSCLPKKREKESKAGWNKRKHNEVNGKGEKKRTVGPRVSTPTRAGMGQQLVKQWNKQPVSQKRGRGEGYRKCVLGNVVQWQKVYEDALFVLKCTHICIKWHAIFLFLNIKQLFECYKLHISSRYASIKLKLAKN